MKQDCTKIKNEIDYILKEIYSIQSLLRGKYKNYAPRKPIRDKKIAEIAFQLKKDYNKFIELFYVITKQKKLQEVPTYKRPQAEEKPFKQIENQLKFTTVIKLLNELSYDKPENLKEKRIEQPIRDAYFIIVQGDRYGLDSISTNIKLREYDVIERYSKIELRLLITNLQKVEPEVIKKVLSRILLKRGGPEIKIVMYRIASDKDIKRDFVQRMKIKLSRIKQGEIELIL